MSFVRLGKTCVMVSAALVALCVTMLLWPGLNWGVDFTGGTILERRVGRTISAGEVRSILDAAVPEVDLSRATIQLVEGDKEFIIRTQELSNNDIMRIDKAFQQEFGGLVELRTEVVGPVIGRELVRSAVLAVLVAAVGILLYVTLRFEYRFAAVAVAALLHDVALVLGSFVVLGREINSPFVAAILTVVGYSINNTIVIFDRIRENLRMSPREPVPELVERSIRQSLTRSINTSITTFLAAGMLVVFGGSAIRDFALALVIGLVVGTYSSVLVSGPMWLMWSGKGAGPKTRTTA
ncbi:MAG: protein translocase subunit SecF [Firmicutes bacterium]|nr:protein translocase subunit SecF [Bacillota bacterium]